MALCLRRAAAAAVGEALRRGASTAPWRRAASASYHHTIQALPRETAGPRAAARERRSGRVPAVLLALAGAGPGEGVAHRKLLTADRKQLGEILKQSPYFLSTPVRLQVRAGERSTAVVHSGTVLPIKFYPEKAGGTTDMLCVRTGSALSCIKWIVVDVDALVHRDETTGNILNLVLVEADEGTMLKVNLPVEFKGEDKIRTSLVYLCPAEHIPPKIEVDLANLDIGDRVSMNDIPVHPSLKLLSKNETMPVCKILASKPVE
uniref:Large ribosomal subunit protein bL25 beta domain-containing protein n=1 Tax=Oryza glumipatula TaxID=40148 RepID=A0A0D9ZAI9_9ORYZ